MLTTRLASYILELGLVDKISEVPNSFQTRLGLQKTVYLLEEAGAKLGYSFGWYKHGPYSSSLADDLYQLASLSPTTLKQLEGPVDRNSISKFKELTESMAGGWPSRLELLSDVHYVVTNRYPVAKTKKEVIEAVLTLKGDHFSRDEIEKAFDSLKNARFVRE